MLLENVVMSVKEITLFLHFYLKCITYFGIFHSLALKHLLLLRKGVYLAVSKLKIKNVCATRLVFNALDGCLMLMCSHDRCY